MTDPTFIREAAVAAARSVTSRVQVYDKLSTLETIVQVTFNGHDLYRGDINEKDAK